MDDLKAPPPSNIKFERYLLARMMNNNEDCALIISLINEADFYFKKNIRIFRACSELMKEGAVVQLPLVVEKLQSKNEIDESCTIAYVSHVVDEFMDSGNIEYLVRRLKELRVLREIRNITLHFGERTNDCKNVDEFLRNFQNKVSELIIDKSGNSINTNRYMHDYLEGLEKRIDLEESIPTGFIGLDNVLSGLNRGSLVILAGRPSMGKTAFMVNMSYNVGKLGLKQAVFSLEMSKTQFLDRMVGSATNINSTAIKKKLLNDMQWAAITDISAEVSEFDILIDDTSSLHYSDICSICRHKHMTTGLDVVFIDYLGFIKTTPARNKQRYQEVGEITNAFKSLAGDLNIIVVLLCQLNRGLENRSNKRPKLHDLRESGDIEQDSDVVIGIYREAFYKPSNIDKKKIAELLVLKNRNGPRGYIELYFDPETMTFKDLDLRKGF